MLITQHVHIEQRGPIDFLTYQIASDNVARGESPYGTIVDDLAIWRAYHRLEEQLQDPGAPEPPVRPGPYLYPPTLALIIAQTGIGPIVFAGVIVLSVWAFVWIWLRATGMHAMWLLFVVFSWDIFAAASGGNVELVVLGLTMVAARLLWSAQPAIAAPFIAFVLLVKPFYILFFAAFVVIVLCAHHPASRRVAAFGATAVVTLVLMGVDLYRWGPTLRAEALEFMREGINHHWFVLPVAEQTPMSIWNRTPMQGLVNAGMSPSIAFPVALTLWAALAGVTAWRVSRQSLGFPQAFALAFVLLYWGRPISWTLSFLEFVVLAAIWPAAGVRMRRALMVTAVAVMASHWLALVLTARRVTLQLFTLQTAEMPWETWLLLPVSWFLLLESRTRPALVNRSNGVERLHRSSPHRTG